MLQHKDPYRGLKGIRNSVQRGFALVELSIATAILGVILLYGALEFIDKAERNKAEIQGRELNDISGAFAAYITNVATPLMDGIPPENNPGNASFYTLNTVDKNGAPYTIINIYKPTYRDLINLGYLPGSVIAPGGLTAEQIIGQNKYNGGYLFRVTKSPQNCTRNDLTCELSGLVALSSSVTSLNGQPSYALAGLVGDQLRQSATNTPGNLTNFSLLNGPNLDDTIPGPFEMNAPGVAVPDYLRVVPAAVPANVGSIVLSSAGGLEAYLRRDGSTPMTGNLRMQDNTNAGPGGTGVKHNIEGANFVETKAVLTQIAVADDVFIRTRGQWLSDIIPQFTVVDTFLATVTNGAAVTITKPNCTPYVPFALDPATQVANPELFVDFPGSGFGAATPIPDNTAQPRIYAWPVSGKVASRTDVGGTIDYVNNPNLGPGGVPLPPTLQLNVDNNNVAVGYYDVQVADNGANWRVSYTTDDDSVNGVPPGPAGEFSDALLIVQVGCFYP